MQTRPFTGKILWLLTFRKGDLWLHSAEWKAGTFCWIGWRGKYFPSSLIYSYPMLWGPSRSVNALPPLPSTPTSLQYTPISLVKLDRWRKNTFYCQAKCSSEEDTSMFVFLVLLAASVCRSFRASSLTQVAKLYWERLRDFNGEKNKRNIERRCSETKWIQMKRQMTSSCERQGKWFFCLWMPGS